MKDTIWITVLILAIIVIVGSITFIIYNNNNSQRSQGKVDKYNTENIIENEVDENAIGNYLVTVSSSEEKLSPNAYMIFDEKYTGCGHTIKTREFIDEENANLTEEEIQELYKDWQIVNFSRNEVELYKEVPGECDEHYIVRDKDGNVAIYKIGIDKTEILIEETEISTQYLPETDQKSLREGVKIYTKDKLNAYLENFE